MRHYIKEIQYFLFAVGFFAPIYIGVQMLVKGYFWHFAISYYGVGLLLAAAFGIYLTRERPNEQNIFKHPLTWALAAPVWMMAVMYELGKRLERHLERSELNGNHA